MTITKQVCRDCGAEYTSGSPAKSSHTRLTGHTSGWKSKKVKIDVEHKVSYQPGYGPQSV